MNTFQTIVLGIFGFFIIVGITLIATTKSRVGDDQLTVTLWGSASQKILDTLKDRLFPKNLTLNYTEISPERLDRELVEALASGRGPDLILLPLDLLFRHRDKLYVVPYSAFSERDYRDRFIQAGDGFLSEQGIFALPFSVDPLVMYWNRDLFDEAAVTAPPRYWDEFLLLANRITARDRTGNISRSAVAFGEYRNVAHAKEILTMLLLQSGHPAVSSDATGNVSIGLGDSGAQSVIDFFTEFSNPGKTVYSWNRAFPNSRLAFLKGQLAMYFGFGSEREELRQANPNLNFDVAYFPKPRSASLSLTHGKLTGVAILRTAGNLSAAYQAALLLSSPNAARLISVETGLPPVERSLLSVKPTGAFQSVLFESAIRSRGFLDPYPVASDTVFQTMIESITSGRARTAEALSRAASELRGLIR